MKKRLLHLIIFSLLVCLLLPAIGATAEESLTITHQPQNSVFTEYGSASWSVEATGKNLTYDWYIVYHGVPYNTKKAFEENHAWQDGVVGDGYGWNDVGNVFFINGIGTALEGAKIYCVVSDGTKSIKSEEAYISVSGTVSPPELVVPAAVEIQKGKVLKLLCKATAWGGDEIKSYLWYETSTGKLEDIIAIGVREGYEETNPVLVCDTGKTGTRYYVCMVETEKGGRAYSSVIPVTVVEKQEHIHSFGKWMVTTKPTCTESGIKTRECDCGHTERAEVPATGHQWDEGRVTKEPTQTLDGEKTFTCKVCKKTRVEVIKALGSGETPSDDPETSKPDVTTTPGATTKPDAVTKPGMNTEPDVTQNSGGQDASRNSDDAHNLILWIIATAAAVAICCTVTAIICIKVKK